MSPPKSQEEWWFIAASTLPEQKRVSGLPLTFTVSQEHRAQVKFNAVITQLGMIIMIVLSTILIF